MKLAASTLLFAKQPLEIAFEKIAELGFTHTDLAVLEGWCHWNPSEIAKSPMAAADRLEALESRYGITVVSLNAGVAGSRSEQRLAMEGLRELAMARSIPIITLPAAGPKVSWDDEASRLEAFARGFIGSGVSLTLETHLDTLAEKIEMAVVWCERIEGLGLTLDPSHLVIGGEWPPPWDRLSPYVRHVHLRQSGTTREALQQPVHAGCIDFPALVGELTGRGYDGWFSAEYIEGFSGATPVDPSKEARELKSLLCG